MKNSKLKIAIIGLTIACFSIVSLSFKSAASNKKFATVLMLRIGMKCNTQLIITDENGQQQITELESGPFAEPIVKNFTTLSVTLNKMSQNGYSLVSTSCDDFAQTNSATLYIFEKD